MSEKPILYPQTKKGRTEALKEIVKKKLLQKVLNLL